MLSSNNIWFGVMSDQPFCQSVNHYCRNLNWFTALLSKFCVQIKHFAYHVSNGLSVSCPFICKLDIFSTSAKPLDQFQESLVQRYPWVKEIQRYLNEGP